MSQIEPRVKFLWSISELLRLRPSLLLFRSRPWRSSYGHCKEMYYLSAFDATQSGCWFPADVCCYFWLLFSEVRKAWTNSWGHAVNTSEWWHKLYQIICIKSKTISSYFSPGSKQSASVSRPWEAAAAQLHTNTNESKQNSLAGRAGQQWGRWLSRCACCLFPVFHVWPSFLLSLIAWFAPGSSFFVWYNRIGECNLYTRLKLSSSVIIQYIHKLRYDLLCLFCTSVESGHCHSWCIPLIALKSTQTPRCLNSSSSSELLWLCVLWWYQPFVPSCNDVTIGALRVCWLLVMQNWRYSRLCKGTALNEGVSVCLCFYSTCAFRKHYKPSSC